MLTNTHIHEPLNKELSLYRLKNVGIDLSGKNILLVDAVTLQDPVWNEFVKRFCVLCQNSSVQVLIVATPEEVSELDPVIQDHAHVHCPLP
jgi:hypothetical protein